MKKSCVGEKKKIWNERTIRGDCLLPRCMRVELHPNARRFERRHSPKGQISPGTFFDPPFPIRSAR